MLKLHLPLASQLRCWLELNRDLRFSELHWRIEENETKITSPAFKSHLLDPFHPFHLFSHFVLFVHNLPICMFAPRFFGVSKLLCCSVRHVSPLRAVALGFLDASQRRAASAPSRPWCSASARSAAFTDLRGLTGKLLPIQKRWVQEEYWQLSVVYLMICRYLQVPFHWK